MAELKPCPFCGGVAELMKYEGDALSKDASYIFCPHCGFETGIYSKPKFVVEKWNRRAGDPDGS